MAELTSPDFPPDTTITYSGELKGAFAPGAIDYFTYRGALVAVRHEVLPPTEEAALILRGMGQDVGHIGPLLEKAPSTITTQSRTAFKRLGQAGTITRAIARLFMPEYGPVLTVERPIELPEPPEERLTRVLQFMSVHTKYAEAAGYPDLNPGKVKEDVAHFVSMLGLRNRDELMLWGNAARILGPGEAVINTSLQPPSGPPLLREPAAGIPHGTFSIRPESESLPFPRDAVLPPGAAMNFVEGRLAVVQAWGGAIAVNRRSELYGRLTEVAVNHIGTMALGLSARHAAFLGSDPDYARRLVRQNLGLADRQPTHSGLQRAFDEELLTVAFPAARQGRPTLQPQLVELLPALVSRKSHREIAADAGISERMLSYWVLQAREQLNVEEFSGAVTFGHLTGLLPGSSANTPTEH